MITLYGSPRSSAGRCLWTLEEAGVQYQLKEVDMRTKEHKSPGFLEINPNGKVPALVDGDLKLFESMAINFYIAESYKRELLGSSTAERAQVMQWSFWASSELQGPIIEVFIQKVFVPDEKRDQNVIKTNLEKLPNLFGILDQALSQKKYLVSDQFTLADINVASVATITAAIGFDLKPFAHVSSWMKAIADRPAFQRYMALRK